jgi:pilus assembly protein Flp/PilA
MLARLAKLQTASFHAMNKERGATAVEYGLLVALIAAVIIAAVTFLGGTIRDLFNNVGTAIPATVPAGG